MRKSLNHMHRSCTEKCTEADSFIACAYLCTEMDVYRNRLPFVPNAYSTELDVPSFWCRSMDLASISLTQFAPKATEFREITQNNGHYAVQGHSRSPILVPMESPYATSYMWIIVICVLSCNVSEIWWIIDPIFAVSGGVPLFNTIVRSEAWIQYCKIWSPETRHIHLSYGAKHISISWTVKAWITSVTERQTDRLCHNKCRAHLARRNIWTVEGCSRSGRSMVATPIEKNWQKRGKKSIVQKVIEKMLS